MTGLLLPVIVGCTALSDFDVHQCETDTDCDVLDGVSRCIEATCRPGCRDNGQCAALDSRAPICSRPGGECVPLVSEESDCFMRSNYDMDSMGKLSSQDMLIIPAFAPSARSAQWLTMELAASELNAAGGLRTANGTSPVVLVLCDGSAGAVLRSTDHLINDLNVRGLVASLESASLSAALTLPSTSGKALFLSPEGSEPDVLQSADDPDLLWYLGAEYRAIGAAYAELTLRLVEVIAARGVATTDLKLVALVGDTVEDDDLTAAMLDLVRVGDADRRQLTLEDRLRTVTLVDDSAALRDAQVAEIVEYAPDIVLVFAGGYFSDAPHLSRAGVVSALEASIGPTWTPLYLFGPRSSDETALRVQAANHASFRRRAIGLRADAQQDMTLASALRDRFTAAFSTARYEGVALEPSYRDYDAVYQLAYALSATQASGSATVGTDVSRALKNVSDRNGPSALIGPAGIETVQNLLQSQVTFSLRGATGALDFDSITHNRTTVPRSYCWAEGGDVIEDQLEDDEAVLFSSTCAQDVLGAAPL